MGLGPSYCLECEVFTIYVPNKEHPNQQGEHVCPYNEYHPTGSTWDVDGHIWINTQIVKENQGLSFPDK